MYRLNSSLKVKNKKVNMKKKHVPTSLRVEEDAITEIIPIIIKLQSDGRRAIYMDEITFGSWFIQNKEWYLGR